MSLNANDQEKAGGFKGVELETGGYPVRLRGIFSCGKHSQEFQGEVKAPRCVIGLTYEFLDEFLLGEDEEPDLEKPVNKSETMPFYSLDSDKAKSTKRYLAIDPNQEAEGDWTKLLNTPLTLSISQEEKNGKKFSNISGIAKMRSKDAEKAPDMVNPTYCFDFYEPTMETWTQLPQWVQKMCKEAVDYAGSALEAMVDNEDDKEETKRKRGRPRKTTPVEENKRVADLDDELPF